MWFIIIMLWIMLAAIFMWALYYTIKAAVRDAIIEAKQINDPSDKEDTISQIKCPMCGVSHDMDYPKCPQCNYKNGF
ncbi:MAG: hypothetical protein FWE29_04565 [Defluviitaleaceae bacterium]|nr:hypothetical protein [Defluviitaleaceae bacterium]